jgi:hypothetical protein
MSTSPTPPSTNPPPPEPKPKRRGPILLAAAIGIALLLITTGVLANGAPPATGPDPTPPTTPSPEPTDPPVDDPSERTDPAPNCDPSYPDVCLDPAIEDYDCAGGSGNGPGYVDGPTRVRPPDPFDLDRDGDGWGCDR